MTPRQVELVRETFPVVQELSQAMTSLFYGRLFSLEPGLRAMFHGPIEVQGLKFGAMLTSLVDGLADLERQRPALRAMGLRHAGYGVTAEHYELVGKALMWALSQALEADGTPEVRAAWLSLIEEISTIMLSSTETQ